MSTRLAHTIALDPPPEPRTDALHKLTSRLCRENQAISIEDLPVKGMIKNTRLARSSSGMGWSECRRQRTYKAPLYGSQLHIIGRFEPWSNKVSLLSDGQASALSERATVCLSACGYITDRDLNAAQNINQLGQAMPEVTPVESRALVMVPIMTQLSSRKQEPTCAHACARER